MNTLTVSLKTDFHGGFLGHGSIDIPLTLEPGIRHDVTIPIALYPGWEFVLSVRPSGASS